MDDEYKINNAFKNLFTGITMFFLPTLFNSMFGFLNNNFHSSNDMPMIADMVLPLFKYTISGISYVAGSILILTSILNLVVINRDEIDNKEEVDKKIIDESTKILTNDLLNKYDIENDKLNIKVTAILNKINQLSINKDISLEDKDLLEKNAYNMRVMTRFLDKKFENNIKELNR